MKENYQRKLDAILIQLDLSHGKPKLLLHACCAPCSSYVLEYLSQYFEITLFFYNPNIFPPSEYSFRAEELSRLVSEMPFADTIPSLVVEDHAQDDFYSAVKGLENEPEGGKRCYECYRFRLEKAASHAKKEGFDYFTTTLSISPYKNADWLNSIGAELSEQFGVAYLFSDFKKKSGYLRSCRLSEEYGLYRQEYCGCIYSKKESEDRKKGLKEAKK